jgi:hypothetical protein
MNNAGVSKLANVEQLRLALGLTIILGMTVACLSVAAMGWRRLEGPTRQYPNSSAVGLPKFIIPVPQLSRCSSWGLIVDSRFTTTDRPELVLDWYQDERREYMNAQPATRSLRTRLRVGPLTFDFRRSPAISLINNVTQITILTNMQVKLCP